MPNLLNIKINAETSDHDVELFALSADRTSDQNLQGKASEAKVELKRRDRAYEREEWQRRFDAETQERRERFNAESEERVKSQQWQEAQSLAAQDFQQRLARRQQEAQELLADKQLRIMKWGTFFAALAAFATTGLVLLGLMEVALPATS